METYRFLHKSARSGVFEISGKSTAATALNDLFILRGSPTYIRSDKGFAFVAQAVRDWIAAVGTKTA